MSKPRSVEKNKTYLLTRRCAQRQFLLKPSEFVNQVFLYCLAVASERFEMAIHAVCVLANHYHLVATDVKGRLPEFMHWLNLNVAKCLNAHYGRWESFWAPGSYSAVETVLDNDVLAKTVYTLNNPVDAGLVARGDLWPGLRSRPQDMWGKSITVARPQGYFSPNGLLPETATLTFSPPPVNDPERFIDDVMALIALAEKGAQDKRAREGKRFLGRKAVLKQHHTDTPLSREPRRTLNPRIACRDKWRRIEAIGRLEAFQDAYHAARLQFRAGHKEVLFPPGTYWLVRHAGARCAGARCAPG